MAEKLFAEFEAATYEDWLAAARASLRGRPLESLVRRTYEDIDIHPLAGAEVAGVRHADTLPGVYPFRRGATASGYRAQPWLIAQVIDSADPAEFNAALRAALANGQTAITLSDRLKLKDPSDLRLALAKIDLEQYPLFIQGGARAPVIYRTLQNALSREALSRLRGCAGYDPLSALARNGHMPSDAFERLAAHVDAIAKASPRLGSVQVSAAVYHDAGANAAQELAIILATAAAYIKALGERGFDLDLVAEKLQVELCIGENFFMEVAKFRAVKLLWAQMLRAFGIGADGQRIRLHARSGGRNKTRRDRHVNLLRLTTEALAAALGGVDSLTLAPFDEPLGESDEFSRRLSRNVQLILQDEVELTRLIDPAGGAWHIERLTDELARRAWAQFQDIEADGGMLAALESGRIEQEVAAIAERRKRDVAAGAAVLVGVNRYIDHDETLPETPSSSPDRSAGAVAGISVKPLKRLRLEAVVEPGTDQ